jgi:hypothetical protein
MKRVLRASVNRPSGERFTVIGDVRQDLRDQT